MHETRVDVAIVGSGFAGLGAAVRLREAGREDFLVLEKGATLGGTWRDNTYPGCACDVQSHFRRRTCKVRPADHELLS